MADKVKASKRKGADVGSKDTKSVKKAKLVSTASNESAIADPITNVQPRASRKRAADLFDAAEEEIVQTVPAATVTKKVKKIQVDKGAGSNGKATATSTVLTTQLKAEPTTKTLKLKQKVSKQVSAVAAPALSKDFEEFESSDNEPEIDTAELLAGFETSSESGSDDDDQGIPIAKIPQPPPANAKAVKAAEKRRARQGGDAHEIGGGTLYIGHIPHGFYERQMHAYFSQFGTITRLRLARNKKTGKPKHYAFVEFASADVADIVQRTMDKYLLFNHILQVRKMADEEVHEKMWRGSEKRFKVVPWAAIQARALRTPRERDVWKRRVEREQGRRTKRKAKLDAYGYDFDAPSLRAVDDVAENDDAVVVPAGTSVHEEIVAEAIESGTPVPQDVVDANTLANGGEPLETPVPADEVQLKQDHELEEQQQQQQQPGKGKFRQNTKAKRNVSAPIVAAQSITDVVPGKPKKAKKSTKSRVSV